LLKGTNIYVIDNEDDCEKAIDSAIQEWNQEAYAKDFNFKHNFHIIGLDAEWKSDKKKTTTK